MKNESTMCFFIHNVHLCHFVTLWVTSFFSLLPWKSYFSSLTFLVSLSCQLIFLSPCTPVIPITSFLISPTTLFFSFFCRFFFLNICAEPTSETQTLQNFVSVVLWIPSLSLHSFFLFVAFLLPVLLSLFHLYRLGAKNRHKGKAIPTVSIMSFCAIVA